MSALKDRENWSNLSNSAFLNLRQSYITTLSRYARYEININGAGEINHPLLLAYYLILLILTVQSFIKFNY
jgi:hypothetical protein